IFRGILEFLQLLLSLMVSFLKNLILCIFPSCKRNFAGEIVLITGSANGIGRQIVLKFAPLGATLVLWDIDDEGNKETCRLAQQRGAKRVFVYHCDCSNREEVYAQADKVRKEVGDVTILINDAGILPGKMFIDTRDEDFENTLKVNFFSQVWTCKAFLPAMMRCDRGHLVSMSSSAGLLGGYRSSDYSASKFAIVGMMEAINSELYHTGKRGIKFTIICPYFVNTKLARGFQSESPLLPVSEPDYVASRIVDAIQRDKFYLVMPLTIYIEALKFVCFISLFPRKVILFLESCFKIPDSMEKAYGR
ncbi:Epidermal retinol dehydrogenase 2, partial [Mesitornis unicolor]